MVVENVKDVDEDWNLIGQNLKEVVMEKENEPWIGTTLAKRIGPAQERQLMAEGHCDGLDGLREPLRSWGLAPKLDGWSMSMWASTGRRLALGLHE